MTRRKLAILVAQVVDPFFFGQPSGIARTAWQWVQHGTSQGSIWLQIYTTMEEAVFGFFIGVAAGVVVGVLLGQFRFLSDVLSPYIKAVNALPRIVLGALNTLVTKSVYVSTLATDKTQFLPDGLMPAGGPNTVMAISKLAGVITGPVNLPATYTNSYAETANKTLGFPG